MSFHKKRRDKFFIKKTHTPHLTPITHVEIKRASYHTKQSPFRKHGMRYGDIGPFGNKINQTPDLDRIAKEGNMLTQFYVANTTCIRLRTALLTGTDENYIEM